LSLLLNLRGITKTFDGLEALGAVSFGVTSGTIVGVIGPNGAGKTTLFNVISGFLHADEGEMYFNEEILDNLSAAHRAQLGIARSFQKIRLAQRMSVLNNVLLFFPNQPGEKLHNLYFRPLYWRPFEQRAREKGQTYLDLVGLGDKASDLAGSLSYGQQKLLCLACCLVSSPKLLLLDEPVSGISPVTKERILDILKKLPRQQIAVVVIEHDVEAISKICNHMIFMDAGRIICEGSPEQVINDPKVIKAYLD